MRVVIAEDSTLLREGLVRLLAEEGHEVVAAVGDATALLERTEEHRPDLVLTDVRMPPGHTDEGLRAALEIRRRWPEVAVLVLSQYVEKRYATELITTGGGRVGYLLKDRVMDVGEFLGALERVAAGGEAFDPDVVRALITRSAHADPLAGLTARERDVLEKMAQGHSNPGIGQALSISRSAVEKHINAIFEKLGLTDSAAYSRRVLAIVRYLQG
ncbi:response regulator transcription factor [Lentzea sp. NPDC042327]|uniref:response regulator transcription factor n=1 Tax=Lentzea sp. NPDC042327 TaxID=3154801 RepID=UPI00340693B3